MKWLLFVFLGALLAGTGCGMNCGRKAGQCDSNSDCPAGQVCLVDRRCQAPPTPPPPLAVTRKPEGNPARAAAPRPLCQDQCREVARACKLNCKLRHPVRGPGRHDCALSCEVHEHECRARARC